MYSQECASCDFREECEEEEYCTFELCIFFPIEEKEHEPECSLEEYDEYERV